MTAWRKSTFCNGADACVEASLVWVDGVATVMVRDSKETDGPVLLCTPGEWAAFVAGVRDGQFDLAALAKAGDGWGLDARSRVSGVPLAAS